MPFSPSKDMCVYVLVFVCALCVCGGGGLSFKQKILCSTLGWDEYRRERMFRKVVCSDFLKSETSILLLNTVFLFF